jgi:uncharacterized protein YjiS (DUF1127 family)
MRYDWPWQGDAIASPVCRWFDRKDGAFEGFEGRSWDQAKHGAATRGAKAEQPDFADRPTSSSLVTSIVGRLWSRIRQQRESRRMRATWEMIDDRTLEDIGISRYDLERARYGQQRG